MGKKTPLYDFHLAANAKIVDFAGWDMPLHYGSQIKEHLAVRAMGGIFDVSHMGIIDITGSSAQDFLRYLLANNIDKLNDHQALYTCLLNHEGKILDDLIAYRINATTFRLVVNASTKAKDWDWVNTIARTYSAANLANLQVQQPEELCILAIQGPQIKVLAAEIFSDLTATEIAHLIQLKPFNFAIYNSWLISRTGYTGEDGYEIILAPAAAKTLWQRCCNAGIIPCGLGARDTLRLEAGLNLYGADMNENTTPWESNLGWTVALEPATRDFIGKNALLTQKQHGITQRLVGLILKEPGVLRNHQRIILDGNTIGEVTSGGFSPTLNQSIALARIFAHIETQCHVEIRNKLLLAQIIKPPFVRHGRPVF